MDEPSYLDVLENFAAMVVFVNIQGENFFGNDARVIVQVEAQTDALGRCITDETRVSFWEVDGDELTMALPEGGNMLAMGVEESLEHMMAADPLYMGKGGPIPTVGFMLYQTLQASAGMWFEEKAYPIVRDRVFPIPRSFGANLLLSDPTGESLDVWSDDGRDIPESVIDAVRSTLHLRAIAAG